jgi:hypothetical protein
MAIGEGINTGEFRMCVITKLSPASVLAMRGNRFYSVHWSQCAVTLRMLSVMLCVFAVNIDTDTAFAQMVASGHYCSDYSKVRHCSAMWSRRSKKCECVG